MRPERPMRPGICTEWTRWTIWMLPGMLAGAAQRPRRRPSIRWPARARGSRARRARVESESRADGEIGVCALDELCGTLLGPEVGEPDLYLAGLRVRRERVPDGGEALAGLLECRAGQRAHELVAADANDDVVRAQLRTDRADRALQQPVARGVPMEVVDRLQADDVDIGDDEPAGEPASAIDLVIEVGKPRAARARPGQRVGLRDQQLVHERFAVGLGLRPVAGGLLAVPGRLLTVRGGPRPGLGCRCAVGLGTPAVLRRPQQDFRARRRAATNRPGGVAR